MDTLYKCEHCDYTSNRSSNVERHTKAKHACVEIVKPIDKADNEPVVHYDAKGLVIAAERFCGKCKRPPFCNVYYAKKHEATCDGCMPLQCNVCLIQFLTSRLKYNHVCGGPPRLETPMVSSIYPKIVSINGRAAPPKAAGVYFATCNNPDKTKFVFNSDVPEGKEVLCYGCSGSNMYGRVERQASETGDYEFLDCLETRNAREAETGLKAYARLNKLETIKGTVTSKSGIKETRTEFFIADAQQYKDMFAYMKSFVQKTESRDRDKMTADTRAHELVIEEQKTKQLEMIAEKAKADLEKAKVRAVTT